MIVSDHNTVQGTLNEILNKECHIAVDRSDLRRLFGEDPKLRMIQIAANSIDKLVPLLKQDIASIGSLPDSCFAAYISMDLKMSDMQLLDELTEPASQCKRTIIFENSPLGAIVLYFFFE